MTNNEKFIHLVEILDLDKKFLQDGRADYSTAINTSSPEHFNKFIIDHITFYLRLIDQGRL